MDVYAEKRIRRAFDEITNLHSLPSLGQLPAALLKVRVYVPDEDTIRVDLDRIRGDIVAKWPGQDTVFDVRVVAIAKDGSKATSYLVGWDQLERAGSSFEKTRTELASFVTSTPTEIDPMATARALGLLHDKSEPDRE